MTDSLVWQPQDISGGTVTFQPGQRYAVLASVGTGTSLQTITNYVQGKGFQVSYICEIAANSPSACSKRDEFNIDTWLQQITAQPRSGERWVYAEGNFASSEAWSVPVTDSFPKTLIATYYIENLFEAVAAPPSVVAPGGKPVVLGGQVVTPPGSSSSGVEYVGIGIAVVAVGAGLWWWLR